MSDTAVRELAAPAGIAVDWSDYANRQHRVSADNLRRILAALQLPCDTAADLAQSRRRSQTPRLPPLVTANAGQPIRGAGCRKSAGRVRLTYEDGTIAELTVRSARRGAHCPPSSTPGYHRLRVREPSAITLAVAPPRCFTIADVAPEERLWGLAVQIYGLRRAGDCGIGDTAGVIALAGKAAAPRRRRRGAQPGARLFAADPDHFSPYSPSSRLFYNPLHADARTLFGAARVRKAAQTPAWLQRRPNWSDNS